MNMKKTKSTEKLTDNKKTKQDVVEPKSEPLDEKEPKVKRHSVFDLQLTKFELLHLRDLMSILLPPDGSQTVSEALAAAEERNLIESMLWDKVSKLCNDAGLPLDSAAPDYVVAPIAAPPLGVFQVNQELSSESNKKMGFFSEEEAEEVEEHEGD